MIDQKTLKRKIQEQHIHPPEVKPPMGESRVYTATLGQINAARRRNALIQVQQLIREHSFTLEEIEGRA